ncbi:hypothetical protein IAT38_004185 [Cryptococcus sp. DSM 104549]
MAPKQDPSSLLEGILSNGQVPHQPLVVIHDGVTFSGLPLFREMIRRGISSGQDVILVSVLHPQENLLPKDSTSSSSERTRVVDLTGEVPGFQAEGEESSVKSIQERILSGYTGGQIFVDALDVLAEDYTPASVLGLVRSILAAIKDAKAPSRLVLVLPPSPIRSHLTPPTFTPTLTLLTPNPPPLLTHLSRLYLSPISTSPSPNLWMVLENASKRSLGPELAYRGEQGLEVERDWGRGGEGVVQCLVRKSTGGIKGIARSLEGVRFAPSLAPGQGQGRGPLGVVPLETLVELNPLSTPVSDGTPGGSGRQATTHAELDLPFNLSLTDAQRKQREAVPLPYAHEGEGASGDLIWEDEEETDDEEI